MYSEFTTYAAVLNLDDDMKISFLKRGVNDELSIALSYQLDPPTEFALFPQMCITLDNQARMRKNQFANQPVTSHKASLYAAPRIGTSQQVCPGLQWPQAFHMR